jgi:hypothetical protein
MEDVLWVANAVITVGFIGDAAVKCIGLGMCANISRGWNLFDAAMLAIGVAEVVATRAARYYLPSLC